MYPISCPPVLLACRLSLLPIPTVPPVPIVNHLFPLWIPSAMPFHHSCPRPQLALLVDAAAAIVCTTMLHPPPSIPAAHALSLLRCTPALGVLESAVRTAVASLLAEIQHLKEYRPYCCSDSLPTSSRHGPSVQQHAGEITHSLLLPYGRSRQHH
jgi:hypothetical protein